MKVLLPLLLLGGCEHKVQTGAVSAAVRGWAPPPREVTYARVNLAGEMALPDTRIRDAWEGPVIDGPDLVYLVTSWDVTPDARDPGGDTGKRLDGTRVFYGPDGFGYLGTVQTDGSFEPWEPRQVVLPPKPRVGDHWEATHKKGSATSVRSCDILASDFCDQGLVVVCESQRDGGRIILRDHFCPEVGWGGFEALVQAGQQPSIRMWSEQLVRDGVAVRDPEP